MTLYSLFSKVISRGNNAEKLHFGLELSSFLQKLGQGPQKKFIAGDSVCARFFCELGGFFNFLRFLADMVILTFFLWEIIQKFFFYNRVFISWQLEKTVFMVLGGSNRSLGPFWLIFWLKKAIFELFSLKFHVLQLFKIVLCSKTLQKLILIL